MPYLSPHDPAIDREQASRETVRTEDLQALMAKMREELLRAYKSRAGIRDERPANRDRQPPVPKL